MKVVLIVLSVVIVILIGVHVVLRKRKKGRSSKENLSDKHFCVRPTLSAIASKALDDAMDVEDDQFRDSKMWN